MILLENKVCSLDLAKRLKESRVKKEFYKTPLGKKASLNQSQKQLNCPSHHYYSLEQAYTKATVLELKCLLD
jgi:hypothetical protein